MQHLISVHFAHSRSFESEIYYFFLVNKQFYERSVKHKAWIWVNILVICIIWNDEEEKITSTSDTCVSHLGINKKENVYIHFIYDLFDHLCAYGAYSYTLAIWIPYYRDFQATTTVTTATTAPLMMFSISFATQNTYGENVETETVLLFIPFYHHFPPALNPISFSTVFV